MISNPKAKKAALFIAEEAQKLGGKAYYVGGCVRDSLLKKEAKDIDIEIFGLQAKEIESILSKRFKIESVGKNFGVWILKGYQIDVSMPRKETKSGLGHKSFDIIGDPFLAVEEACARRDFTINAMLCDILSGEIIDCYNGRQDIENKILRHTTEKFVEDPLRVLRAMQFSARFDLDVAPETVEISKSISIENLPKERIFQEWKKLLLKGNTISKGLFFLRDCQWAKYFPALEALVDCPQDAIWHPEGDVYRHTAFCLDSFAKDRIGNEREDLIVGLAVLCHDLGKPKCTVIDDNGRIHSHGHDMAGGKIAARFLKSITDEKSLIEEVVPLVERHMAILDLWRNQAGDSAIRRLANKVGRIDRLVRVDKADREGRPPIIAEESPQGQWILEKAQELKVKDSAPKPILMGRHLIELGYKPTPLFGKYLEDSYEAQLDGEFFDIDGAIKHFKEDILLSLKVK